jgi:tetratricopeptide (TPR) repeat protein
MLVERSDVYYGDDGVLELLGDWYSQLKDYAAAMAAYKEILDKYPSNYNIILCVIRLLKEQNKNTEILAFLENLNTHVEENGLTRLIATYHELANADDFHQTVNSAAYDEHKLDFVKETFQVAIAAASNDRSKLTILASLRHWFGYTLLHYPEDDDDHDKAMKVWEQNVALQSFRDLDFFIRYQCNLTAGMLASVYIQRAREVGLANPDAQDYVKRLRHLANLSEDDETLYQDTRLLLGRCCSLMGDHEEARKSVRHHIRHALKLLSDDDPSNDWQGYKRLAIAFTPLANEADALAAWSMLGPFEEKEQNDPETEMGEPTVMEKIDSGRSDEVVKDNDQEPNGEGPKTDGPTETPSTLTDGTTGRSDSTSSTSPPKRNGPLGYSCDGHCGHGWTYADDIYACKDCMDTQFDARYIAKLKAGTLGWKGCHPNHDFLHIPKWDDNKSISPNRIMVGGEEMLIQDWLNRIRKEWGFEIVPDAV